MPFLKLQFKPGVDKEGTIYSNTTGWFDSDKVRFDNGRPENIGGWVPRGSGSFVGICRKLHPWTALDKAEYIGIGTHLKLYTDHGGEINDITPYRVSAQSLGADPLTTTSGSAVITVADTAHGARNLDFVTIAGSAAVDDIPASEINANHQLTYVDADSYTITVTTTGTAGAAGGGASVTARYEIHVGQADSSAGIGWGIGGWGGENTALGFADTGWGDASTASTSVTNLMRIWTMANFGEDLLTNVMDGGIYYWDKSDGDTARAEKLEDQSGSDTAPTVCRFLSVSAEDRHVLAFGCGSTGSPGTQDKLLIRWPDRESLTTWTPDTENSAGSLRLNVGSEIEAVLRTKREHLVWTDGALSVVTYTGEPFFFGTRVVSTNTSIIGPNVAIETDSAVFWMGRRQFFMYDGTVKTLECTLQDDVFRNMNLGQKEKFHVGTTKGHNEVTWYYCTTTDEITHYVTLNYVENVWYGGTLVRTAWIDTAFADYPIGAAISSFIESSDFETVPGDGYQYGFTRRLLPDLSFNGSTAASPAVTITLTPRNLTGESYGTAVDTTVTRSGTDPETYTKQAHIRIRSRSIKYKIASNALGVRWRDGTPRLETRPDGRAGH